MRAAITGATGFIGSHLTDALLDRGWKVRVLRHRRAPHRKEVEVLDGRIDRVKDLIPLCEGVDIVFHLASAMGSSRLKPDEFFRINVEGTRAILQAARETHVPRVVHVSSAGVLGSVPRGIVADESYPPSPLTIYDRTKWEGEKIALAAAASAQDVMVLRPGWVYGPRDRRTYKLIRAIKKRLFLLIGDGSGFQSPVWIHDLIRGILLAAGKGQPGKIYHLSAGEILTVREMVSSIASALQVPLPAWHLPVFLAKIGAFILEIMGKPFPHYEPPLSLSRLSFFLHSKPLDIRRAQEELGYYSEVPFAEGIILAVRWYQENGWL